jgi:hypothetical protein
MNNNIEINLDFQTGLNTISLTGLLAILDRELKTKNLQFTYGYSYCEQEKGVVRQVTGLTWEEKGFRPKTIGDLMEFCQAVLNAKEENNFFVIDHHFQISREDRDKVIKFSSDGRKFGETFEDFLQKFYDLGISVKIIASLDDFRNFIG